MSPRRLLAALSCCAVGLVACGSDDGPDRQAYVDGAAAALNDSEDEFPLEGESADCVAGALVDAIGIDRLEDADIGPDDFAEADSFDDLDVDIPESEFQEALADGLAECRLGALLSDVIVAQFPIPPRDEDVTCLSSQLDGSEEFHLGLAQTLATGADTRLQGAFVTALVECPGLAGNLLADAMIQAGVPIDDAARACFIDELGVRGEEGVEQMLGGGAAAEQLGADLVPICLPDLAG